MLDISEDFLGVSLTQIDAIAGREILDIKVTVARSGLRGHPHKMSQHVGYRIACRVQAGNFDLLLARLAEPHKRMTIGCCRAGTKIHVEGSLDRSARLRPSNRFHICRGRRRARRNSGRCHTRFHRRFARSVPLLLMIGVRHKLLCAAASDSQAYVGCEDAGPNTNSRPGGFRFALATFKPSQIHDDRYLRSARVNRCVSGRQGPKTQRSSGPRVSPWLQPAAGYLPIGVLPTGYLPTGYLPIGAF